MLLDQNSRDFDVGWFYPVAIGADPRLPGAGFDFLAGLIDFVFIKTLFS